MITQTSPMIPFINNTEDALKSAWKNDPAWLKTIRDAALKRFLSLGLPTTKDEEWKYTNISSMTEKRFSLTARKKENLQLAVENYIHPDDITLVFNNGILDENLSNFGELPKGLKISNIAQALKNDGEVIQKALSRFNVNDDTATAALNSALFFEGATITLAKKTHVEALIHIIHLTETGNEKIVYAPRTIIHLEESSQVNILESHLGVNDTDVYAVFPLTDIYISQNATLHYCKAQRESLNAYHVSNTRVWQERDSIFEGFSIQNGSTINRNNLDIILNGEGITSLLNGLYYVNGKQLVDNHTFVDHRFPNCTSNQLYKGVLNGSGHAVFNGKIFVKPIAQKTNSYQLNKNLLIGTDCRIDTKPQLEIFADDVKCTHGATIGQLNEDELFYLETRSIGRREAKKILATGFMDDLLNTIKSQPIREKMRLLLKPVFNNF